MPERELVKIERTGAMAVVTMDNPATMNAMDQDMGPALARALEGIGTDRSVRAMVLTGGGGVFSAGGNLAKASRYLEAHPDEGAGPLFAQYTKWVHRVLACLTSLQQPVVCAVEGAASGAGLAWMLASDMVVAAENARLVPGFVAAGLVPAAGTTWHLPRLMGILRAGELLMFNQELSPARALDLGLVDELCPPGQALERALELAGKLAQEGPREALASTKALLNKAARQGLLPQAEDEREKVLAAADTLDFRERARRFAPHDKQED